MPSGIEELEQETRPPQPCFSLVLSVSVQMKKVTKHQYGRHLTSKKPIEAKKKPIKIKYISSPMMVQANSALEFREIVQELTGQNSDPSISSIPNSQATTPSPSMTISEAEEATIWDIGSHDEAPQTQYTTENTSVEDQFSSIMTSLSHFLDEGGRHFIPQLVSESFF